MSRLIMKKQLDELIKEYGKGVPKLAQELETKLQSYLDPEDGKSLMRGAHRFNNFMAELPAMERVIDEVPTILERVITLQAGARPVARIRNNQITTEFIGPDSESWGDVIREYKEFIDKAIPAVGRIELKNSEYNWVGTGWLVAEGIIVTNRHVADYFSSKDPKSSQFVFLPGLLSGPVISKIDFLEEDSRSDSVEHSITSVLWIATSEEVDVAFLRISKASGIPMPRPIDLADDVKEETLIAAIGYPARDSSIRDQELVIRIFGDDVYEKKRLAPGKLMGIEGTTLTHDCSTLGGNSGSVLLNMKTGKAVGIHYGGLANDLANLGVTAPHIKTLLAKALRQEAPIRHQPAPPLSLPGSSHFLAAVDSAGTYQIKMHIPIEISVKIGRPVPANLFTANVSAPDTNVGNAFDAALLSVQQRFSSDADVLHIRQGYRFKNGWITDEPVIVIIVKEKMPYGAIQHLGKLPFPREFLNVGIDVRTAAFPDQLQASGINLAVQERRGRIAGYKEPLGYNDPQSDMYLARITDEEMDAVFHVSPDTGFVNLKGFLGRIKQHLTATMYEWEPNHISDALEEAMKPNSNTLLMVTQKLGVMNRDATKTAVEDMKQRLGDKFSHVWASVRGTRKLFPSSYHIKVASRDGEEVWLSSGNWKDSNQPENPTSSKVLYDRNREWHAIINNKRLATLFQKYIEYDFREAHRFPLEEVESDSLPEIEFFIALTAPQIDLERVPGVSYNDELIIRGEKLDIQPLLTPDRDANQSPLFMKAATEMIQRATKSIYIQNQSFAFTDSNNSEFDRFFTVLKEKQQTIDDVRVIFRDAKDFGRLSDLEDQQLLIERLKNFGFDVSPKRLRLQAKCHTKGIIVDSKEVLIGSQNLTNQGSLFNRDASLLVRSPKVAEFYEKIFLFDWQHLAHNNAEESTIRRARPGEETPRGFRRVKLTELLQED